MEFQVYENTYRSEQSHWWFEGRRTLVLDQIERLYGSRSDLEILDVGCGTGLNMKFFGKYGRVTGVDLSPDGLAYCRARGHTRLVMAPVEKLPFEENSFDLITTLDVMEHLDDDLAGFVEICRVLKPGGRVIVLVPAYMFLWSLQDEVSHHRRRYVASQLRATMGHSGLQVERVTYSNTLLFPLVFGGRLALKLIRRYNTSLQNENNLHPGWSNGILKAVFRAETPLLRTLNFPFGVSILAIARKPGD